MDDGLTIVEVVDRLGIGGAEAHVRRLTRELLRRDQRVVLLARDAGAYGDEMKEAGASLALVPFNREGLPRAVELILPMEPDVVHAHGYRAARFGAPLARALETPYLMTVHGPLPWWKRALFDGWSDTVLALTEADRDGIVGLFGVSADRVEVGRLGVDTQRFRPGLDATAVRSDWGVAADRPLVMNVGRFTRRRVRAAKALLEVLPRVREEIPEAGAVFVGEGSELNRIQAAAEKVNDRLGGQAAIVVGPRTDIPEVMNAGDVVVATATTAMEALASAVPTIACGGAGYFGVVRADNFERARALGFADRGRLPDVNLETFADDLTAPLRDPGPARRAAAEVREIIAPRYGSGPMVDQIEGIYRRLVASGL